MGITTPKQTRRLVITAHAYERAAGMNLASSEIAPLFWGSIEEKLPIDLRRRAAEKYQNHHDHTKYYRNGTYVMVVGEVIHIKAGDPIHLLLTIYDQRLDLPG